MKQTLLNVEILSAGRVLGTLTSDQFRAGADAPASMFLPEVVERWNAWKASIGEPERARIA